jgi:uncharacterized spore protein YtfJ
MGSSRNENILENMLGAENVIGDPQSRNEALLIQLLEKGGGGSGGAVVSVDQEALVITNEGSDK